MIRKVLGLYQNHCSSPSLYLLRYPPSPPSPNNNAVQRDPATPASNASPAASSQHHVKDFDATMMQAAAFRDGRPVDTRRLEGRIIRIACCAELAAR
jgi:hypothetical protein